MPTPAGEFRHRPRVIHPASMSIWLPLRTRSLTSPILRASNNITYNSLVTASATTVALRRNAHILAPRHSTRTKSKVPGQLVTRTQRHASTSPSSNEKKASTSNVEEKSTDVTATAEPSSSVPSKPTEPQEPFMTRAWAKIKHEANHYWDGTKLLGAEIKVSWRLLRRLLRGKQLTRRERRQVFCFSKLSFFAIEARRFCILISCCLASTNDHGLTSPSALFGLHCRTVHGAAPTCGHQTLPQHATIYF